MNNDQQSGVPQQPEQPGWQQPGQQNQAGYQGHPEQPQYGQPPYPPRADQYNVNQPPYGEPGQGQSPYGQPGPGQFGQAPPKGGFPVWGWVASGVGAVAVLAVAGVMVLGGLGSNKQQEAAPGPTETSGGSESAGATEEATTDGSSAAASGEEDLYIFQDADFTSAPVWSTKMPEGWTMSEVKGGTIQYRSKESPCNFTTHQAILPPRDETTDEEATKTSMQLEIDGIKSTVGKPVTVVTDADSLYTKLRNADGRVIELQEAELRFKNKSDVDVVYRIALRSMPAGDGLMELILACPANLPTESELWTELTDSVTMVDDPAA
ncbi:hypothetical protein JOE31_001315 [Arthrobacter sp. PvP023]|uniref:hypothetical protein n=1 Tax=Micrococcaceae TaxID=1268 RepID=UPI001AE537F8|nr:hypothetical protein [Arthrobacter sp. PvP023]MBP1135083.1 hypothetical protein [Arthrobacter sp. PvP023]